MFGTLCKNKAEIPPEMQPHNARPERSFGFLGNLITVSYAPSRGKAVVLLSTMHQTATSEGEDKPEIVLHYNNAKSGVDNIYHLDMIISCRRKKQSMANGPLL